LLAVVNRAFPLSAQAALPRQTPAGPVLGLAIQSTLVEIDGFAALGAGVRFVKLIGKDLLLFAAFGAFAIEGFKRFKILEAWAVLGCRCHVFPPLLGPSSNGR
jgi:hypothetical protein